MSRISLWYLGLSRSSKILFAAAAIIAALAVSVFIIYMMLVPQKVEVKHGTIVWDPIDGHIWEDNTETLWVEPSEAANYRVEYIVRYSSEHEEQLKNLEEQEMADQQQLEESEGLEAVTAAVPTDMIKDLETMQSNMNVMGQDIMTGLEMANELSEFKSSLQYWRNQIAAYPVIPELENYKQQLLSAYDKGIAACDLYLTGISTADTSYLDQANALIQEATAIIQNLGETLKNLIPPTEDLQNLLPTNQ